MWTDLLYDKYAVLCTHIYCTEQVKGNWPQKDNYFLAFCYQSCTRYVHDNHKTVYVTIITYTSNYNVLHVHVHVHYYM